MHTTNHKNNRPSRSTVWTNERAGKDDRSYRVKFSPVHISPRQPSSQAAIQFPPAHSFLLHSNPRENRHCLPYHCSLLNHILRSGNISEQVSEHYCGGIVPPRTSAHLWGRAPIEREVCWNCTKSHLWYLLVKSVPSSLCQPCKYLQVTSPSQTLLFHSTICHMPWFPKRSTVPYMSYFRSLLFLKLRHPEWNILLSRCRLANPKYRILHD